ncbi:MAG: MarR family winged helix-turn-helix transcriptional regulator [Thiohalomonadales bacterium]
MINNKNSAPGSTSESEFHDVVKRVANLRQRLLRASRIINIEIVNGLHKHGFTELTSSHTALLSNLDLKGSRLTDIAQRAGMTKQAMGRLADELINLNYIKRSRSQADRRAVKLTFTSTGRKLMNLSFTVMKDIEIRCAQQLGEKRFNTLLSSLHDIVDEFENGQK